MLFSQTTRMPLKTISWPIWFEKYCSRRDAVNKTFLVVLEVCSPENHTFILSKPLSGTAANVITGLTNRVPFIASANNGGARPPSLTSRNHRCEPEDVSNLRACRTQERTPGSSWLINSLLGCWPYLRLLLPPPPSSPLPPDASLLHPHHPLPPSILLLLYSLSVWSGAQHKWAINTC